MAQAPPPHRVAVITGAANGLGRALALTLAGRGHTLALVDTDAAGLERLREALGSTAARCTVHPADIADEQAVAAAHAAIVAQHRQVDLLINNAAISISRPFLMADAADMERVLAVNLGGTVRMCRHFLPDLRRSTDARLVNIISAFALLGFPGKTAYASSKAAVMGFTQALRTELGGPSLRVSLVIPPPMATGFLDSGAHLSEAKRAAEQAFVREHAMGVDDVAARIVRRVLKGDPRIVIGPAMFWADLAVRLFPSTTHRVLGRWKHRFRFI
ncbi:MAG: SDR family NAD(P)-dependent oxidoreductase [Bacteroidetes bacterium]|nr:SDR family NAD(P)-dependent oxidoreductase [Bacteroidota bacterium]